MTDCNNLYEIPLNLFDSQAGEGENRKHEIYVEQAGGPPQEKGIGASYG